MLFIDAQNAGISGDMLIAGLLDLGAEPKKIDEALKPIIEVIGRYEIKRKKVKRGIYRATWYRFNFQDKEISYQDALSAIKNAELSKKARSYAISCFETLATAESRVHGIKKQDLHMHDVPDTISDFVVSAALLDDLGIFDEKIVSSRVNIGKGFFKFHGKSSTLPAPATAEILKGVPIFGESEFELTTPTGASLLVNMTKDFVNAFPLMKIDRIGYGAGYKDLDFPNALKLYLGKEAEPELKKETLSLLETNVDTATGETLGYLFERLFDEGALDVVIVPCIMKKNRPGHIIKVMCKNEDSMKLTRIIMDETGTLGVRMMPEAHRHVLERGFMERKIRIKGREHKVRFKKAFDKQGNVIAQKAEYEDLKKIAKKTGLSLRDVERMAMEKMP